MKELDHKAYAGKFLTGLGTTFLLKGDHNA